MTPFPTNDERLDPSEIDIETQIAAQGLGIPAARLANGLRHAWPPRHATLWLDTEFNGWGGELISLALVDDNDRQFYEVIEYGVPQPWVLANVIPVLGLRPVPLGRMQAHLAAWLSAYDSVHVVSDWPDDVAYLCKALITGPGERIDTPALTFEIRRDLDAVSAIPHNALEDAKAMRARHLQIMAVGPRRYQAMALRQLHSYEEAQRLKQWITPDRDVQASAQCEGKDPLGCWHVRCQLDGKCQHRVDPNEPAARAGATSATASFRSVDLSGRTRAQNAISDAMASEDTRSGAGAAGAVSASGASVASQAAVLNPPAGISCRYCYDQDGGCAVCSSIGGA